MSTRIRWDRLAAPVICLLTFVALLWVVIL